MRVSVWGRGLRVTVRGKGYVFQEFQGGFRGVSGGFRGGVRGVSGGFGRIHASASALCGPLGVRALPPGPGTAGLSALAATWG